jgi:hypothetical protein
MKLNLLPERYYNARMDGDIRYYQVYHYPVEVWYPSVTSVIGTSKFFDHTWLEKWKKNIGEAEANKISNQATRRGRALHLALENYMLGINKPVNPITAVEAKEIIKLLDKHVNNVRGIELTLSSDTLQTAGTSDLVADWKSRPSIIDYKTKRYTHRSINPDDYEHYFVQAAAYAFMMKELYSITIEDIVIIMSVEHQDPLVFEKKVCDYQDLMMKVFQEGNRIPAYENTYSL